MSKGNLAKGPISPEVVTKIVANLTKTIEELKQYEVNLTESEKTHIPKAGELKGTFIDKGLQYMKTNPIYLSGTMDTDEANNDRTTQLQAINLNEQVKIIEQILHDLAIAAGSDAYIAVLDYYNSVKRSADKGDASAKQIAADLGRAFNRNTNDIIP